MITAILTKKRLILSLCIFKRWKILTQVCTEYVEQASVRNHEVGGAGALPQSQQLFFGELVILTGSGPLPPLSTLLSLLEQASVRNVEVGGGWRAPAKSEIIFWRSSPSGATRAGA